MCIFECPNRLLYEIKYDNKLITVKSINNYTKMYNTPSIIYNA